MCASVITAKPKSASTVQHHGEQDAIIYAVSGRGVLLTSPADENSEPTRHELVPGDFAFVPAWTEHQALNESEGEDMVWVVIRSGPVPVEVSLTSWGGPQIEDRPRGKNV
ncbi:putative cupin domain-containing protein [Phaeoacremonium minimum UCRPA7]|uniref:Putative cupin domain-containing protein n=1 Tax=Phaeoacremonium minimum (strain UCR-PA7) TaxID=1286976 RepID=R8BSW5_PHAM7|nr:putative cupin domain-containing protein [Phaeoacremonium minimum UCRPA7]EOO02365.1 putative cupin domain-containing protein [Phaeoacremonium minimum UCRPA7]